MVVVSCFNTKADQLWLFSTQVCCGANHSRHCICGDWTGAGVGTICSLNDPQVHLGHTNTEYSAVQYRVCDISNQCYRLWKHANSIDSKRSCYSRSNTDILWSAYTKTNPRMCDENNTCAWQCTQCINIVCTELVSIEYPGHIAITISRSIPPSPFCRSSSKLT